MKKLTTILLFLLPAIGSFANAIDTVRTPLHIEQIKLSTSGCYGTCPIFDLTIDSDRHAILNAKEFNTNNKSVFDTSNTMRGWFMCTIDSITYDSIVHIINNTNLPFLNDYYKVRWTDDETANLEIKYNNGTLKKICDYGEMGTKKLEALYHKLYQLRFTQKWTKKE